MNQNDIRCGDTILDLSLKDKDILFGIEIDGNRTVKTRRKAVELNFDAMEK